MVLSQERLMPFYRHYFSYYKLNKRVVVAEFLNKLKMHDTYLFNMTQNSFDRMINEYL